MAESRPEQASKVAELFNLIPRRYFIDWKDGDFIVHTTDCAVSSSPMCGYINVCYFQWKDRYRLCRSSAETSLDSVTIITIVPG